MFHPRVRSEESSSAEGVGYDQFVDILLMVGAEVIGSQHQPSGSSQSGVHVLVGSIQVTYFT